MTSASLSLFLSRHLADSFSKVLSPSTLFFEDSILKKQMSSVDLVALRKRARQIQQRNISDNSKEGYLGKLLRLANWLYHNDRAALSDSFCNGEGAGISAENPSSSFDRKYVKAYMAEAGDNVCPFNMENFNAESLMCFLAALESEGTSNAESTFDLFRSAACDVMRRWQEERPEGWDVSLGTFFQGMKNTLAEKKADGVARATVSSSKGALPMPSAFYRFLMRQMLICPEKQSAFVHAYSVVNWVSLNRMEQTSQILIENVGAQGDHLFYYKEKTKTDQSGDLSEIPFSIHANPLNPAICPITTLAIYFAIHGFEQNQIFLFGGKKKATAAARYEKGFKMFIAKDIVQEELAAQGLSKRHVQTHAFRKGGSTDVSQIAGGFNQQTLENRAGWSQTGVKQRYCKMQAEGDAHISRMLSGLPQSCSQFAVLPAHFLLRDESVERAVADIFPHHPANMNLCCEMFLAQLVFHGETLRGLVPPAHPLMTTSLFRSPNLINELLPKVYCGLLQSPSGMVATGIPTYTLSLVKMDSLIDKTRQFETALAGVTQGVVDGVVQTLESRSISLNQVTRTELPKILAESMEEFFITRGIVVNAGQRADTGERNGSSTSGTQAAVTPSLHMWGGRFHPVPENFEISVGNTGNMWQQWSLPDHRRGIPPLRHLRAIDLPKSEQKKFGELKFLMNAIEQDLREKGKYFDSDLTLATVNQMFEDGCSAVGIAGDSAGARKRTRQWRTVAKDLRTSRKKGRETGGGRQWRRRGRQWRSRRGGSDNKNYCLKISDFPQ